MFSDITLASNRITPENYLSVVVSVEDSSHGAMLT